MFFNCKETNIVLPFFTAQIHSQTLQRTLNEITECSSSKTQNITNINDSPIISYARDNADKNKNFRATSSKNSTFTNEQSLLNVDISDNLNISNIIPLHAENNSTVDGYYTCSTNSNQNNVTDFNDISLNGDISEYIPDSTLESITFNSTSNICPNEEDTNSTRLYQQSFSKLEFDLDNTKETVGDSNISEFIPELTLDSTHKNDETYVINDKITPIPDSLNINNVTVPYSYQKSKKHFCKFCNKLQTKFARHLFAKHRNEEEVTVASKMPARSVERLRLIEKIRKDGDFIHNTSESKNTGMLIVRRNRQTKSINLAKDYLCCKTCKGFYSKVSIRMHRKLCEKNRKKK